jgi:hypothetical protein
VRAETIALANAWLIEAQSKIALAQAWGGGEVRRRQPTLPPGPH